MKRSHALFDIAVLAVYLLAANPALTGIPLHEFLGLGAFIMVAAHVVESGEGLGGRGRVGGHDCVLFFMNADGAALPGAVRLGLPLLGSASRGGGQGALGGPARASGRARSRRAGGSTATQGSSRCGKRLPDGPLIQVSLPPRFSSLYCAAEKSTACLR